MDAGPSGREPRSPGIPGPLTIQAAGVRLRGRTEAQ